MKKNVPRSGSQAVSGRHQGQKHALVTIPATYHCVFTSVLVAVILTHIIPTVSAAVCVVLKCQETEMPISTCSIFSIW